MEYRFRALAAFILLIAGAALYVLCIVLHWPPVWRSVTRALVVAGNVFQFCVLAVFGLVCVVFSGRRNVNVKNAKE